MIALHPCYCGEDRHNHISEVIKKNEKHALGQVVFI
jgi:hypothetical protein